MARRKTQSTKNKRSTKASHKKRWLHLLLKYCGLAAAWGLVFTIALLIFVSFDLPSMEALTAPKKPTVTILANDGSVLTSYSDTFGEPVPFDALPKHLINAVIATEDRRFFSHFGIDPLGIARAMVVNLAHGGVRQGGSTITQQLSKISFLTHDRTFKRKVQEAILALQVENYFTKEEIMAMYLNRIYLGAGNYGVDAAAQYYFGKNITEVDIYEAAMLAGLIKAPSRYAPSSNPELSAKRATQVLDNMANADLLSIKSIAKQPYKMPVIVAHDEAKQKKAPYFTDWIMEQLPEYVGSVEHDLTVFTTLDVNMQALAEDAIRQRLLKEGDAHDMTQGALITLSDDGKVMAMVGGRSYAKSQYNRATQAKRQPGSAFKPFIYATAFEYGLTPDDVMVDEPVEFGGWSPQNYNKEFLGEMTLETAFSKSINTIAVKLTNDVGVSSVVKTAHRLGIASEIEKNLSSALGSSEVTLLEMTNGYAHFASNGKPVWAHGIKEIQTGGITLYKREASMNKAPLLKPSTIAAMNRIFMHTMRDGTARNANIDRDAGGKTGTSQQYRDAWFIGYTPGYVTGIWFGNDDNQPMHLVTGGGAPARSWKAYMSAALADKPRMKLPLTEKAVIRGQNGKDEYESFWDKIFGSFESEDESSAPQKPASSGGWIEYDYPSSGR